MKILNIQSDKYSQCLMPGQKSDVLNEYHLKIPYLAFKFRVTIEMVVSR